jgi:phage tail protein X
MAKYRSREGDTIDLICWRVYGDVLMSQSVLRANRGVADLDLVLPVGTVLELPEITATNIDKTIKLWD